jgi:amidohydrolase
MISNLLATILGFAAQGPTSSSIEDPIEAAVQRVLPRVIEARRAIHAHPELGERELETSRRVSEWLTQLGLEVRTGMGGTGVVGVLRGGKSGACVMYRADMDALPVVEATGLAFASQRRDVWDGVETGVMHACGHDVHTAIALGVAAVLADPAVRSALTGTVLFVFQPAEEGLSEPGLHGAARMLAEGVFSDPRPERVFGLHVNPILPVGRISAIAGGALAAADRFVITVRGRQTHGAYPQAGVDPIVAAAEVIGALQTIVSRNVDARDAAVISVGRIQAGNRFNIIPESAVMEGTIRTHDESVRELVQRRMGEVARHVAEALGATAEVEIEMLTPVTVNDRALVQRLGPVLESVVGAGNLVEEKPHMGAEDFAYFAREAPGLFYFLGVGDFSKGVPAMIHTPAFDPDERAIPIGLRASTRLVLAGLADAATASGAKK